MTDGIGMAGGFFSLIGFVFAFIGAGLAFALVRGAVIRRRVLTEGIPAEARCLDTYVTRDAEGGSRRKVILGFSTRDGQQIRFEESPRSVLVTGDVVPIRYLPDRPQRAAVVGSGGAGALVGTAIGLVVCAMFVLVGLTFGLGGLGAGIFGFSN